MKPTDLQQFITDESAAFAQYAAPMTEAEFADQPNGRWSVGDTAQHLYLSVRPVVRVLSGPREIFAQWSEASGPSRTYEAIAADYHRALATGIKAPPAFSPRPDDIPDDKTTTLARLADVHMALAEQVAVLTDNELDRLQVPHPAMGMMSLREMILFTGVHTRHHIAVLEGY